MHGTNKAGIKSKYEIVRQAAEPAERIYRAMVDQQQQSKENDPSSGEAVIRREDVVFDPTRSVQTDRETVLARMAKKLIAAKKQKV